MNDNTVEEDKLIIARKAKKTIVFIEKNITCFPNEHILLKNKIIDSLYKILEEIYRSNLTQNKESKLEIIVQIQMINFYLKQSLDKCILTKKKFITYSKHLNELHKMIYGWYKYEESK